MPQSFREWKVLPHGKLVAVDQNIMTVTGDIRVPLVDLPRRMTVVRLRDGRLVIYSAMALREEAMQELEAFGRPAYLVVPNQLHRLDARIWKQRYPEMQVVAPSGARGKVDKVVQVDTTDPDFADPDVRFVTVPGTRDSEAALVVKGPGGTTLVLNDIVGNIQNSSGFGGWFLRLVGFAGSEPQIPKVVKFKLIEDRAALRGQLMQWAELPALKRILVSHGSAIEEQPQRTLRDLASSLS